MKPKSKTASVPSSGNTIPRRNHLYFPVILALLALLAVVLRIVMTVEVINTDPFAYNPPDVTDMATYHALSRDILNGTFFALALANGLSAAIMNPGSAEMMKTYYSYRALMGLDEKCADYLEAAPRLSAVSSAPAQAFSSSGLLTFICSTLLIYLLI